MNKSLQRKDEIIIIINYFLVNYLTVNKQDRLWK